MKISEIIEATGAKVLQEIDRDLDVRISTDTRTIKEGDFYLPLKGASFDGEKFIDEAIRKGAAGAFCTLNNSLALWERVGVRGQLPLILQVNNTLEAYLQLANYRRKKLDFKVIAVTGSSGKTTTKELTAAVCSQKFKTFKTPLNHNNEIGFCQTIFEAPDDTEVLVLEMGMRGLGEIELLSKYAEPDITIIANVGTAHIGRLGSRENIARAKCEIVKYQRGDVFIAHNDDLIKKTVEFDGKKIFYSLNDVKILTKQPNFTEFEYNGKLYQLNVGGDYNVENSLAAINAGIALGMNHQEISEGLKNYHPIEKRWEAVNAGGYEIVNDSYNANPESMRVFVDTVSELYKDYVLILGDMGELGEEEVRYHKELGEYIKAKCAQIKVISIGTLSKNITDACNGVHFETVEKAIEYIKANIPTSTKLFLKASRSMKFERIIESI